jgi:outer membrane receptor for ferrienterochelin and colicins
MKRIFFLVYIISLLNSFNLTAQKTDANVFGDVQTAGEHVPYVNIYLEGTNYGTVTDETGHYLLVNLPVGQQTLVAKMIGYKPVKKSVNLVRGQSIELNFELEKQSLAVDEVVVTGTKTFKRRTESAVIVSVIDSKIFDYVQANTISEGLSFQPGLRVETDCQTCNYTQLRMNGLGGAYSQILINSRPIFSPLTGLYGLEQIPTEMVERIEVVRGGASALYGSSAIGGTVNVITKFPSRNAYDLSMSNAVINGQANDNHINGNITLLSTQRNAGATVFVSRRDRQSYDHNDDGYSEMPALQNNSFGFNTYFRLNQNQKLEVNMASLHEYRRGGNLNDEPAYLADQSEERTHDILMGGADYSLDFENNRTTLAAFFAGQYTKRKHYTGILPDGEAELAAHYALPPYGNTKNSTFMGGMQLNHTLYDFLGGINVITTGLEYNYDDVMDEIETYDYLLDQTSKNTGFYLQSDWSVSSKLTLLTGVRADQHNYVDRIILNPRLSALYKFNQETQFRMSWSTGFRAPQAFDTDMHIAFSGGGIQQVQLADELEEERSQSLSSSLNWDHATETHIYGFTIEAFYTILNDAFILEELDNTAEGNSILEKRNGGTSEVFGGTFEARANFNQQLQLEAGLTLQKSQYENAVAWSTEIDGTRDFLRTPNSYGYYTLSFTPESPFTATLSGLYTGNMLVPHYGLPGDAGTPEEDLLFESDPFWETNLKLSYDFSLPHLDSKLQFFGGVSNIFNQYQDDFDQGKYRDSNYVYGPSKPRTIYFGLKLFN